MINHFFKNEVLIPLFGIENFEIIIRDYILYTNIRINDKKNDNNCCISLNVNYDNTLYLNLLTKSVIFSGTELIKKIKIIADKLKINDISLIDGSKIYFEEHDLTINLSVFYILMNGYTWYNKNDFFNIDYDEYISNMEYNKKIINLPLSKFLNIYIESFDILSNYDSIFCLLPFFCDIKRNKIYEQYILIEEELKLFIINNTYKFYFCKNVLDKITVSEFFKLFYQKKLLNMVGEDNFILFFIELINEVSYIQLKDGNYIINHEYCQKLKFINNIKKENIIKLNYIKLYIIYFLIIFLIIINFFWKEIMINLSQFQK
jgi:hypothetical protein